MHTQETGGLTAQTMAMWGVPVLILFGLMAVLVAGLVLYLVAGG